MIEITHVNTPEEIYQFLKMPEKTYTEYREWVEPILDEQENFFSQKNPLWSYTKKKLFLAAKDGKAAGRIAAFINSHYTKTSGDKAAYFGFFECADDVQVANELFKAAEKFAKEFGMKKIRGPINASTLYETGLLMRGFGAAPITGLNYAPDYYSRLLGKNGYKKAIDLQAFDVLLSPSHLETAKKALVEHTPDALRKKGITLRPFNKSNFEEDIKSIDRIMNVAMVKSHHYQYVPVGFKEFMFFCKGLMSFFDPELIWFIEKNGVPHGVCVVYPNINEVLQKFHGSLGIKEKIRFIFSKKKIKKARLELIAIEPMLQHQGLGELLVANAIAMLAKKGYTHLEYSWVLETNKPSQNLAKHFGGEEYKTYRIFEKKLR